MKNLFRKQTPRAITLPCRLKNSYNSCNSYHATKGLSAVIMADEAITVENYKSLLPPFDPNGSGLFGLVDMGR